MFKYTEIPHVLAGAPHNKHTKGGWLRNLQVVHCLTSLNTDRLACIGFCAIIYWKQNTSFYDGIDGLSGRLAACIVVTGRVMMY